MKAVRTLFVIALAVVLVASFVLAQASGYKITRHIKLGGEGGWDYLTFDPAGHRLYIARATRVQVVDVTAGTLAGELPDTDGIHGVALVPKLGRGVTSNGRSDSATIFDLKTLKPIATVKTGGKPDAIIFDDASGLVLAMCGKTNEITLIDPEKAEVVGTIALPGAPEFAVADGKGMVYVNLEDKAQIAVVDVAARKTTTTYPMEGCEAPTGLSMDRTTQRLFSGCHSQVLVVVDAATGKNVAKLPIGKGVDATAFDPGTRLVFSSNGDGTLSVIHEDSADKFTKIEDVPTLKWARTMALDPTTHTIYTVTSTAPPLPNGRPDPSGFEVVVLEK